MLTSLQSDTREDLKTLLDEYGNALDKGGAEAFNRSIPYWKSAYRDTAIVNEASLGRGRARPVRLRQERGRDGRGAGPQPASQLKSLITDFNTTAGGVRPRGRQPARRDRRAAAHAARRPARAGRAQRRRSRRCARSPRDLRPGVQSSEAALDASIPLVRQLRGLVSEDELRGLAADLRPTIPALARLARESIPLAEQDRLLASCQNEIVLPWTQGQGRGQAVPGQRPGLQRGAEGVPRPRRREPLR